MSSPSLDIASEPFLGDKSFHWISNATIPGSQPDVRWDIETRDGKIRELHPPDERKRQYVRERGATMIGAAGALVAPSLCHPHVHLDKAFLLAHTRYSHLQIEEGTFAEAMELTSQAKANFEHADLLERGSRLLDESIAAGVTHMRAFVEVDPIVNLTCLKAGCEIKQRYQQDCRVQLCAFAQLPLFTGEDGGEEIRRLMKEALRDEYSAEAVGSTPYVEEDRSKMEQNVDWLIDLALEHDKHLDFHLDYNLDPHVEPLVWHVLKSLKDKDWNRRSTKTIVFGHCTRLTLFSPEEWRRLKDEIGQLPVSFVGLPTSDLYMMKTETGARATLNVPQIIKEYSLNAAIGMNNIGNAFTPQGCCDPLYLANLGVGVYQAGTVQDAEMLYECISTRARHAIGFGRPPDEVSETHGPFGVRLYERQSADLVVFSPRVYESQHPIGPIFREGWDTVRKISDAVYLYNGAKRRSCLGA